MAEACNWYESRQTGLGQDFLSELQTVLAQLAESPGMYAPGYRQVRSVRLHRFPYVVHYRFTGEIVVVLAVMFGGRDPSAWQDRTN